MIRTGNEYRDSIRDGREVWINGERVRDVTAHPAFNPVVDIRARIYDMAHEPATRDVMTYEEKGERFAIGLKLPCTPEGLAGQAQGRRPSSCGTSAASSPASATRPSAKCGRSGTARTS